MPDGTTKTVSHSYYKYDGMQSGDEFNPSNAKFAGFRFIINSAGNIPINQHANPIDSARMYEALPTFGYGDYQASDMADAFYLVTFDNFMSPSARYSDYVLPAKTTWEQEDFVAIENSGNLYCDSVIPGPGEALSSWDFAREWIKVYGGAEEAAKFTGLGADSSFKDVVQKVYNTEVKVDSNSPFYKKTWEEFLEKPISHAKPNTIPPTSIEYNPIRKKYEQYATDYKNGLVSGGFFPGVQTADWSNASGVFGFCNDLYDTGGVSILTILAFMSVSAFAQDAAYVTPDSWSKHITANGVKAASEGIAVGSGNLKMGLTTRAQLRFGEDSDTNIYQYARARLSGYELGNGEMNINLNVRGAWDHVL